ncbi:heparinase II/III domain-containing protein [Paenibacillus ferrarius]|uniref:heparinase II/III domain-containing protein n=1 Tax=Paenibacillus ferrarius TaxID=1469647 RepID=UPI003D28D4F8
MSTRRENVAHAAGGAGAPETAALLRQDLDRLLAAGSLVIPQEPGGWWHQYVCPHHHTELVFRDDVISETVFACPHGCRIEGEAYRGAWLVFKHQSLARAALQAAAVYAAGEDVRYAAVAKELIVGYARQFPLYPVHPDAQGWMLKGRAFHQALTEAIWSTTLIRGYLLLRDQGVLFDAEEQAALDVFFELLATSMAEYRHILIHERNNAESNYTAWLNASLSCVHAARGEREALQSLIDGQGGFLHHLSIGVKPDQLEFEGSMYYHVFVLRAYLIAAEMAQRFGLDLYAAAGAEGQSLRGMLEAVADLADDQGALPALHDGPLARGPYAREIAEIAEQGLAIYGIAGLAPVRREAYRQLAAAGEGEAQLEALLYGKGTAAAADGAPSQPRSARLWPQSGFVLGRVAGSPLSFLADFGEHGGSHGHYDKLHLTLMHPAGTLTPDFGMVPYGSTMRRTWFAETASHNTVSLGGYSQAQHEGRCLRYEATDAAVSVWLQSTNAYAGCTLNRHLLLTGEWLLDWFQVELAGEAQSIEWWLHPVVPPVAASEPVEGPVFPLQIAGAKHADGEATSFTVVELPVTARYVPSVETDALGAAQLNLTYPAGAGAIAHTALVQPGDEVVAVQTPGDSVDPSRALTAVLHRRMGTHADFIHVYRAGEPVAVKRVSADRVSLTVPGTEEKIVQLTQENGLLFK